MPRLKGPDDQSALVVRMFRELVPIFGAVDLRIDQLELTPRGSWRVLTDSGAQLELGRGNEVEVAAHVKIFFRTLSQIAARYGRTPSALAGHAATHGRQPWRQTTAVSPTRCCTRPLPLRHAGSS